MEIGDTSTQNNLSLTIRTRNYVHTSDNLRIDTTFSFDQKQVKSALDQLITNKVVASNHLGWAFVFEYHCNPNDEKESLQGIMDFMGDQWSPEQMEGQGINVQYVESIGKIFVRVNLPQEFQPPAKFFTKLCRVPNMQKVVVQAVLSAQRRADQDQTESLQFVGVDLEMKTKSSKEAGEHLKLLLAKWSLLHPMLSLLPELKEGHIKTTIPNIKRLYELLGWKYAGELTISPESRKLLRNQFKCIWILDKEVLVVSTLKLDISTPLSCQT